MDLFVNRKSIPESVPVLGSCHPPPNHEKGCAPTDVIDARVSGTSAGWAACYCISGVAVLAAASANVQNRVVPARSDVQNHRAGAGPPQGQFHRPRHVGDVGEVAALAPVAVGGQVRDF